MRRADQRRRMLKMKGRRLESEKAGEYNRTTSMLVTARVAMATPAPSSWQPPTSMLVAVVLCFVVTELPQGVLAFLSGVDQDIFHNAGAAGPYL